MVTIDQWNAWVKEWEAIDSDGNGPAMYPSLTEYLFIKMGSAAIQAEGNAVADIVANQVKYDGPNNISVGLLSNALANYFSGEDTSFDREQFMSRCYGLGYSPVAQKR